MNMAIYIKVYLESICQYHYGAHPICYQLGVQELNTQHLRHGHHMLVLVKLMAYYLEYMTYIKEQILQIQLYHMDI